MTSTPSPRGPYRRTVSTVLDLALPAFGFVAVLLILHVRARTRLERMGGESDDPTRRFSWMRRGS